MSDDFSVQVGRWVGQAKERARIAFVATGFEALTRVKELTPVDTGWLRSNWQIQREGEAQPAQRAAFPTTPDAARQLVEQLAEEARQGGGQERLAERALEAQLGEKLRIVNPVVYARPVEYGREIEKRDGSTATTRAAGMVARTVSELPDIARKVVEAITGRRTI